MDIHDQKNVIFSGATPDTSRYLFGARESRLKLFTIAFPRYRGVFGFLRRAITVSVINILASREEKPGFCFEQDEALKNSCKELALRRILYDDVKRRAALCGY